MTEKRVSFRRNDMVEGGGLVDNIVATWEEASFEMFQYPGKDVEAAMFKLEFVGESGTKHVERWSVGSDWAVTKDGKGLVPLAKQTGINKGSNFGILLISLFEADFPEEKLDSEDISIVERMVTHMIRTPAPKRQVGQKTPRTDGRIFEPTILIVNEIYKFPWEGKQTETKGKAEPTGDLADKTTATILSVLANNPKGLDKKRLTSELSTALKGDPNRNEIIQMAYKDTFLADGPWTFEKGIVKIMDDAPPF